MDIKQNKILEHVSKILERDADMPHLIDWFGVGYDTDLAIDATTRAISEIEKNHYKDEMDELLALKSKMICYYHQLKEHGTNVILLN